MPKRLKLIFKIGSLFLAVFILQKTLHWFSHNPDIARLLGKSVGAAPGVNLEAANPIIPSISGFSNSLSTAAANVGYGIEAPAGTGGMKPNLSLNYSSASTDDMHTGVWPEVREKNGRKIYEWPVLYQNQASWAGLG